MDALRKQTPGQERKAIQLWSLAIFALAVALRLGMLFGLRQAPSFQRLVLDAGHYHQKALQLLEGRPAPDLFWQPALYPYALAIFYRLFGPSTGLARIAQAVIGGLTAALTSHLGRRLFGTRVGAAAGLIVAAWAPLMLYELDLVADGVSAIWSVVLIGQFLRVRETRSGPEAIFLGLCAALSVLSRPTYLPFVAAGGLWLAWIFRKERLFRIPALALVGWAVVWLPAAGLAQRLTGRFNPLPFSGGLNFYIGNNPDPCATLNVRPGRSWTRLETEPERVGAVWPADREAYFMRRALDFVRAQPAVFAWGLWRKTVRFLNSRELPRNEDPYGFRRYSLLLRVGLWKIAGWGFPFGLLLPWAVVGGWHGRRETPFIFCLFLATYAAAIILVFVSARYRLAWIPPAAILAARGGQAWIEQLRRHAWPAAGATLAVVLMLSALSSRPSHFCEETVRYDAEMWRLVGYAQWKQGALEDAEASLRRALALGPNAETCDNLGRVLLDRGRPDEAVEMLRRAVELDPASPESLNNLGLVLGQQGRHAEAVGLFQAALALDPSNEYIVRNLALARKNAAGLGVDSPSER